MTDNLYLTVQGLGFRVADISSRRSRGGLNVYVVLAKPGGVTLDDCSLVHNTVLPRLEMEYPETDIRLEVSSPGIHRVIKWADELPAYIGMEVSVLPENSETWVHGILRDIQGPRAKLETNNGNREFEIDSIRKAKLESMEEAEK